MSCVSESFCDSNTQITNKLTLISEEVRAEQKLIVSITTNQPASNQNSDPYPNLKKVCKLV